jgi:hypothetical protein
MKEAAMRRMPSPIDRASSHPIPLCVLFAEHNRFLADESAARAEFPWADRFVLGLPLAPWQRGLKWNDEQSVRFITSIWKGLPIGSYQLVDLDMEQAAGVIVHRKFSTCVLDGQQRLHAIERFVDDKLAVPDAQGVLTLWSDLDLSEQRRFGNRIFDRLLCPMKSEAELRQIYDDLNFGGTPHLESERAMRKSPRP